MEEDESQKVFDPTPHKLQKAREKGDVPQSQDIASTLILVVAFGIVLTIGGKIASEITRFCLVFIERPHEIAVGEGAMQSLMLYVGIHVGISLAVLFGGMSLAAVAGHAGQTGLLFSAEKITPKPDKISPIAGFKRLFGKESLMQFVKTLLKLIVLGIAAFYAAKPYFDSAQNLVNMEVVELGTFLFTVLKAVLMKLLIILVVFAVADYLLQRFNFMQRNKMTPYEMKQEFKDTEGDPLIAGKLKQIRMERAKKRMMQNVPNATVVITNPTHYAVALKYVQGEDAAPICVAKGVDKVALKIREVAGEHDVPIVENRPLARALFAQVEVDEIIPEEYYQAVAKIIGSIMSLAAKKSSNATNKKPHVTMPNMTEVRKKRAQANNDAANAANVS